MLLMRGIVLRDLGNAVRARRKDLGLSQQALGKRMGLHHTYIASVERGERNITIASLLTICRGLGCRPSELFSEAGA